jgi:hypothetical protein
MEIQYTNQNIGYDNINIFMLKLSGVIILCAFLNHNILCYSIQSSSAILLDLWIWFRWYSNKTDMETYSFQAL